MPGWDLCRLFAGAAFAQAADPLSGGAGWAGCGLLGIVLGWLCLLHLPAKDKQVRDILALHAEERVARDTIFMAVAEKQAAAFEARNLIIVASIRDQTITLAKSTDDSYQKIAAIIGNACRGGSGKERS